MAETLTDLGVVVDHPEPNVYEVAAGDVDWLFVPLEAAAKMRASFMLLGPLLSRFGRVIISNPGGDRIGRRPVDLHVDAMRALGAQIEYRNGYYYARRPAGCAGPRSASRSCRSWAPRTRCSPRPWPRATRSSGRRPRSRRSTTSSRSCARWAPTVERTVPGHDRGRGRKRLRGAEHRVMPDRIEAGTFVVAGAVTGGRITLDGAPCDHLGAFVEVLERAGVGVACEGDTIEVDGSALARAAASARSTSRPRPIPASRRTSSRRPSVLLTQADGRVARPRDDLRGPPRVAVGAAPDGRRHRHRRQPARDHPRPQPRCAGRTSRSATCAPAPRSSSPRWPPTARPTIHGAHHVHRGYENIEGKFLDLGARIERLAEGNDATSS